MRRNLLICSLILLITATTAVSAQVKQGINEMNLSGSFNVTDQGGESFTTIRLDLRYGHFTSSRLQVGGLIDFVNAEGSDAFGEFGGFAAIHFPSSRRATTVPFLSAEVGHTFGLSEDGLFFGGSGGLKIFVADGGAITVTGYYQKRTSAGEPANYGAAIGTSIFF